MVASTMASLRELCMFSMVTAEALLLLFFVCNTVKQPEQRLKRSVIPTYKSVIDSWGCELSVFFVVTGLIGEVLLLLFFICSTVLTLVL